VNRFNTLYSSHVESLHNGYAKFNSLQCRFCSDVVLNWQIINPLCSVGRVRGTLDLVSVVPVFLLGCAGGFPYLVGGKYAEDYGLVEESCNPYSGNVTGQCATKSNCQRHFSTAYQYVGGYYGAYVLLIMASIFFNISLLSFHPLWHYSRQGPTLQNILW